MNELLCSSSCSPLGNGLPERGQRLGIGNMSVLKLLHQVVLGVQGWTCSTFRGNLVGRCPIVEQTFTAPLRNRHSSWFSCALSHVRPNFSPPAPHLHCHHPGPNHCHLSRSPCFSPSTTAVLLTAELMLLKWEREPVSRQPTNFQRLLIPHRTRCRILPLLGLQAPMICPQPS